jgi:hypothetical protein
MPAPLGTADELEREEDKRLTALRFAPLGGSQDFSHSANPAPPIVTATELSVQIE